MAVRELMTPEPAYCTRTTKLENVAKMMAVRDCGEIPVVEEGRVVGVVTDRDIVVRALAKNHDPLGMPAESVMSTKVYTIRTTDSVNRAIQLMEDHQVRRLPVVDDEGLLVGMLSQADLAEALPEARSGELLYELSHPPGIPPRRLIEVP